MSGEALAHRTPPPPQVLVDWVQAWAGDSDSLEGRALGALDEALRRPGRQREAAEALLAGDALLTALVEEAAEAGDPGAVLDALVELVAGAHDGE